VRSALHRHGLRFRLHVRDLQAAGWRVIVVWECELGAGRGTDLQRAVRLERFARGLVRRVRAS
jgi:G:T-mismatch repair DNA endonuclease (very short patch repair protein)